jgi:voltage-gated potassium channel
MADRPQSPDRIMGFRPRVWRHLTRSVQSGRIVPYLAGATIAAALIMALVMRLVDPGTFTTYGKAVWFSVVTLTTIGYGDVVPGDTVGRVCAGVLMVFGVTFIAFITAVVTSTLITAEQRRLEQEGRRKERPVGPEGSSLERIEQRLAAIEQKLDR